MTSKTSNAKLMISLSPLRKVMITQTDKFVFLGNAKTPEVITWTKAKRKQF